MPVATASFAPANHDRLVTKWERPTSALHIARYDLSALFVRDEEKGIRCSPEIAMLETPGTPSGESRRQ